VADGATAERNFSVEDRTILADSRPASDLRADPVLGALTARCQACDRFARLMTEEPRARFSGGLMCPPTKVLSPEEARLDWAHGAGCGKA
jgi:hypothetical protein